MKFKSFPNLKDENKRYSKDSPFLEIFDEFLLQLKISNAISFAYKGDYGQANSLFSEIIRTRGENQIILDMQARSLAQQGRINEAESLWKKALLIDPDNIQYQNALNRIYELQKRSYKSSSFFYLFIRLAVIVTLIMVITIAANFVKKGIDSLSSIESTQAKQAVILEALNNSKNSEQNSEIDTASNTFPNVDLEIPGINVTFKGNNIIVTFKEGLFYNASNLKPKAKDILTEFGKCLEPFASRIKISIYGCTDNIPVPFGNKNTDNISLGKARASKVFEHFHQTTNLLPDRVLIGTYGEYLPLFSNATTDGREKNRTVTIIISHSD